MKVSKLLRQLRNGILNDKSCRVGGDSDHLWEDEDLLTYIDEAHKRFATRALLLRDATTPEVTQVTLVAGVDTYMLHPAVIAVISARMLGSQFDLARTNHTTLANQRPSDGAWWLPNAISDVQPGRTLAFTTDEGFGDKGTPSLEQVTLRVFPVPSTDAAGSVVQMRVCRKPLFDIDETTLEMEPEIPADNHMEMLDWAAYLALRIVDDDQGAPKRAAEFQAQFEANCQRARNAMIRKLQPTTGWGFGRGGFSWENTSNGW